VGDDFLWDIVGIGALNLDYIVSDCLAPDSGPAESIVTSISKLLNELNPPLAWNTERTVSAREIELALSAIPTTAEVALGGSAFNTICTVAAMQLGLRVGYVGVTGQTPRNAPSFLRRFQHLGIDHSSVRHLDTQYSGICLSITEAGEATMLTHPGSNISMAGELSGRAEAIVSYLASARVVHVTSFLDELTSSCQKA
jgi:sugar/nucleoside kinase (ribokinase family)